MDNFSDFIKRFEGHYFWDVDVSELDVQTSKRIIIKWVFTRGSLEDMHAVILNYGRDEIVEVLCRLNYLDSKTLNFVSKLFDTPKDKFRCYTGQQSRPQYWTS